jgi:hypothetical protein
MSVQWSARSWISKRLAVAVVALTVPALFCRNAPAAFDAQGAETFAGNIIDTTTWQIRSDSVVTQSNGLTIYSGSEVVTANALVPVGAGVRVQFVVSQLPGYANNYPGMMQVLLTDDSAGAAARNWNDSFAAEARLYLWPGNIHPGDMDAFIDSFGSGSGYILASVPNSIGMLGRRLTIEIDRPTSLDYTFSFFDSDGSLMGSSILSAASHPEALHIDLHSSGGTTTTFYSVTIVPEPASLTLFVLGAAALLTRRNGRKS